MASFERFVTDNPFRTLGAGSATSFPELRRKADSYARSASVGLAPDVPRSDVLGTIEHSEIASAVRSLHSDPVRRLKYRLMWPISERSIPYLLDGGKIGRNEISTDELTQLLFLSDWYEFLINGNPENASVALAKWHQLDASEAFDDKLVSVLALEDSLTNDQAYDMVLDAQKAITLHLLGRVATAALQALDRNDTSRGAALVAALLESPIDDDLEEMALAPLAEYGGSLDAKVIASVSKMPEWHFGDPTDAPREVTLLGNLGELLLDRHPAARDWSDTASWWRSKLGERMLAESIRLSDARRKSDALEVMKNATALAIDPDQRNLFHRCVIKLTPLANAEQREKERLRKYVSKKETPIARKFYVGLALAVGVIGWILMSAVTSANPTESSGSVEGSTLDASDGRPVSVPTATSEPQKESPEQAPPETESGASSDQQFDQWVAEEEAKDKHRDNLRSELDRLKSEIDDLDTQIDKTASEIDEDKASLKIQKDAIDKANPNLYSQSEVDDYNEMVRRYESDRAALNRKVRRHNERVADEKRKVRRHNEIVEELNAGR